jgi:hypothetical protein
MQKKMSERGQAVLEMLLVFLILIPLLFGGIELARGVSIRHALDSGLGLAVRALSLDPGQWDWAETMISQAVEENVLGDSGVGSVTMQCYDASGSPLSAESLLSLPFGTTFRLEAQVTFTPSMILILGQAVRIRLSHWGIVERYP